MSQLLYQVLSTDNTSLNTVCNYKAECVILIEIEA